MRYLILAIIAISACNTPATKLPESTKSEKPQIEIAKDSIRSYLKNKLNDPNSLEEVEWGQLVTNDTIYFNNRIDRIDTLLQMSKDYPMIANLKEDAALAALKDSLQKAKLKSSIFSLALRYRAKNGFGGVITEDNTFWLDSNFVIIKTAK